MTNYTGEIPWTAPFVVKYPVGDVYYSACFDRDMRLDLGADDRAWYVVGWGYLMEPAGFSRIRPLTLSLDSGSEIKYDGKTWKYDEFGKLAVRIENIRLTETLANL